MATTVWKGPVEDGITYSLLTKFLECPERFRLLVMEGLQEDEGFNHKIEYGSLWHRAEEAYSLGKPWKPAVLDYSTRLQNEYPSSEKEICKWTEICLHAFEVYVNHCKKDPQIKRRRYFLTEETFKVHYDLPSGRSITLRGRLDGAFQLGKTKYLQENKTKGVIDEEGISKGVSRNLQVMMYFIVYHQLYERRKSPLTGICYNVIRRPLSDRYAIHQKKMESEGHFYKRLQAEIRSKPEHYFHYWLVRISKKDIHAFLYQILDPILERLLDWWDWISVDPYDPWRQDERAIPGGGLHYRYPYGCYHSLASGTRGPYFDYLTTGSTRGLVKAKSLFPELE